MPRPVRTQLTVAQPCAESWAAMTPAAGGRHCAACQQVVVDFTRQTDQEILTYFRQAATAGRVPCGRFRQVQLGRPLVPVAGSGRPGPRWRAWLALLLAAWGSSSASQAAAGPGPHPTHHAPARAASAARARPLAAKEVRGTVRDAQTGQPLPGVAVQLRNSTHRATTDAHGRFRLHLPARRPRGGRALVLHHPDYRPRTVRLPASTRPARLALRLHALGYVEEYNQELTTSGVPLLQTVEVTEVPAPVPPPTAAPAPPQPSWWRRLFRPRAQPRP